MTGGGYKVGYKQPPVATQFQKGQSGNPAGRKKGSKNLTTLVTEALEEKVTATIGGRTRRMSKLEAAFTQQANKAAAGDPKATKLMLDLLAGEETRAAKRPPPENNVEAGKKQHRAVLDALRQRLDLGDNDGV